MKPIDKSLWSAGVVAAAALLLMTPASTPASAAWQTSTTVSVTTLDAGRLDAPAAPTCQNANRVLPIVVITWTKVPNALEYEVVTLSSGSTSSVLATVSASSASGPTLSAELTGTLLNGVISLLTGDPQIAVVAKNDTWRSNPSSSRTVVPAGLSGYLLGGVKCQGT
ncbi:hypothetical protein [uncultured Microbacterium sp.]|uniref:hypothetical protein n=1 Tax=uncultured Microbacterium sp. TaxID=191216 RepID=UPI0025D63626|nr:hypothetical protein [uncultured Microbacterium sp.]